MCSHVRIAVVVCCLVSALSFSAVCADAVKKVDTAEKVDDLLGALKKTGAKVILLNVWSTQCTPCLAEMPTLVRTALKFKNNLDVAFLGLCLSSEGDSKKVALEAASEVMRLKKVTYQNLLWTGKGEALLDRFNIIGTPYTVFVSGEGKVLGDILELPEDPVKAAEEIEKGIAKALSSPAKTDASATK